MMRHTLVIALALTVACKRPVEPETPVDATQPGVESATTKPTGTTRPSRAKPTPEALVGRINDAVAQLGVGQPAAAERAVTMLREVLDVDPNHTLAHFNLGVAFHQLGKLNEARSEYQLALEGDPKLAQAWLYIGAIDEQRGQLPAAIRAYQAGMGVDSNDMEIRVALVHALRRSGKLDAAVEAAKAALRINATSLPVYNALGLVYLEKKDYALARFVYQKASNDVDGAMNNAEIRTNLGWALYQQGEKWNAQRHLEQAVQLDNRLVPALVYLSHLYMDDHNYAETVPLLEVAHTHAPENHGVMMNLGVAYRGVGRFDDARRMYDQALKLDPTNPDPWLNLGVLLGDYSKDYDGSISAFEKYLDGGGSRRELVEEYIQDVSKEKAKVEKKARDKAEREAREAEKRERERLLREAEGSPGAEDGAPPGGSTPTGGGAPWGPTPPADDPPPDAPPKDPPPSDPQSPWETP